MSPERYYPSSLNCNAMKKILAFLLIALSSVISYETSLFAKPRVNKEDMVIGAYVYQSKKGIPDPQLVTHVFFAFAHVSESFDGLYIPDEGELKRVADLKKKNPEVKVLLSVGGWGSGRFSEMAASARSRSSFAKDCKKAVKKFHLDGIDIDWEYPKSSTAKISSSPEDTGNFSLLMKDLREALGRRKLLSIATVCNAKYIDFKAVLPLIDYVNVMAYPLPKGYTYQMSVDAHIAAGVPPCKLVLGMPLYGGENEETIGKRCDYIVSHNLKGGMYWQWNSEKEGHPLAKVVNDKLRVKRNLKNVLVLFENGGWHKPLTDVLVPWLDSLAPSRGYAVTGIRNLANVTEEFLYDYDAVLQIDCPPYPWPKEAQDAFIKYMNEGRGGYAGYHHATLLGEFDGYGMWDWFSWFMGGIRYKNYIAETCEGTVRLEDSTHPALSGVPSEFKIPEDEWYTYDKSPRLAPYIHVLASVDEASYNPSSNIKMGDHPVIWTNTSVKARNIYFQFGHSPKLMENEAYLTLLLGSIDWILGNK